MIKLIASDIDGTLIPDSTPNLYPEIVEEIKSLAERGVIFCGASGRQLCSIQNVFREVADKICYIAENGAHIHYKGEDISLTSMDREYAEQIIHQLRGLGNEYEFVVSTPHGSLLETKNRTFLDMMKYGYHNTFRQVEDVLAQEAVILKVAVYHRGSIRQSAAWRGADSDGNQDIRRDSAMDEPCAHEPADIQDLVFKVWGGLPQYGNIQGAGGSSLCLMRCFGGFLIRI